MSALGLVFAALEYADDAALLNRSARAASARLSRLAVELKSRADMIISVEKSKVVQPRRQAPVPHPKQEEFATEEL